MAAELTAALPMPTIGIGSGPDCDGQILVTTDLWSTSPDYIQKHVQPNEAAGRNGEGDCGLEERDLELSKLTHINAKGEARMVDVSEKPVQRRTAVALGDSHGAGDVETGARGQDRQGQRAGHGPDCGHSGGETHGGFDSDVSSAAAGSLRVEFEFPKVGNAIVITATARVAARTGVEMEALAAVNLAALTIYDMCKAVDKKMRITNVKLVSKTKQ